MPFITEYHSGCLDFFIKTIILMRITGTHFNYYFICHSKLWLFAHGIQMEHTSDLVYEGRRLHEHTYPRRSEKYQEIEMDGIKIDFYDPGKKVIHEIKKSDKMEPAHEWQLKYYLFVLENNGIDMVKGMLEYPSMRRTTEVFLSQADRLQIQDFMFEIGQIVQSKHCPEKIKINACRNCSYYDFCWIGEE